ncbi:MAG: three-Cys-motif partner protein TcmP [Defluviicoccus sp.]|nr:three-Cys-motif partner protein TcmP [Defluviicoccus sp.]
MAAPTATIWDLDPHTRAKHEILRRYLQAWTPILTQGGFPEILYVDGFAGPGRYSAGEDGSPIIALRAALGPASRSAATIRFLFIEEKEDRARILEEIVSEMDVPANIKVEVRGQETFEAVFRPILMSYGAKGVRPPPIFAFIDPFGWTGAPFSMVQEIMGYRSCEVLINFMYEEINRFIGLPDQVRNFDTFFGTRDWRDGAALRDPRERRPFFHNLYLRQLREAARAKFVRSFEMRNERDRVDYYLFYASNNLLGLRKMKEAMWKVDESGEFTFSDATDPNQAVLFEPQPRHDVLRRQILERFADREVTVKEIETFVLAETAFRETHYKRDVLRRLELANPPTIEIIDPPAGRRRGTYGDESLRLRFLPGLL